MLDRALEFLPDDEEFRTRELAGEGLTSPELSVLLAYAKIWLTQELNESSIAEEPYFAKALTTYFPPTLVERFGAELNGHQLRSQIISTVTVNRLLNIAGITFVFRAMEETGASAVEIVRAALASIEIFGIDEFWQEINDEDNQIPTSAQVAMHLETRRLLDRSTRWFLQTRGGSLDVQAELDRFVSVVTDHTRAVPTHLLGKERDRFDRLAQRFMAAGCPGGTLPACGCCSGRVRPAGRHGHLRPHGGVGLAPSCRSTSPSPSATTSTARWCASRNCPAVTGGASWLGMPSAATCTPWSQA